MSCLMTDNPSCLVLFAMVTPEEESFLLKLFVSEDTRVGKLDMVQSRPVRLEIHLPLQNLKSFKLVE